MFVTINSQVLASELRLLNRVVPTKPAIAILSHVLIRADTAISLYATDLEVGVTTVCPGRVDAAGEAALPVARLLQMVEQFPDADVSVELEDKLRVVIRCGAFTSRLQSLPTADFPEPPAVDGLAMTLDAASLRGLINKTRHAASATGTKYVLRGALLTCAGPVAAMVTTDGLRLALATVGRTGPDLDVVVPTKTLDVLAGQGDEGDLQLTIGDRHLFFSSGDRLLTSRKVEGTFPQYQRIVPRDNDKTIVVDRGALTAALKRVTLAAEETGAVWFDVDSGLTGGSIGLSARSAGIGSADEAVSIAYDGPPLKICVNGGFVLDFLNAASGAAVTIALKDAKGSMLLTDGNDHVGVIMLMRNQ